MKLTIIFDKINFDKIKGNHHISSKLASGTQSGSLLRFAIISEPLRSIILNVHNHTFNSQSCDSVIAVPYDWTADREQIQSQMLCYKENIPLSSLRTHKPKTGRWHIIANGKFIARTDYNRLCKTLNKIDLDVIVVNINQNLCANSEKVLINSKDKLVGFRRFYGDTVQSAPLPADWPHYIFIRPVIFEKFFAVDALPLSFQEFVRILDLNSIKFQALDVAGAVFDLDTEDGLLGFIATHLQSDFKSDNGFACSALHGDNVIVADNAKLFGKILLGKNVRIDEDVLIVGPTLIGDGAKISKGAVVKNSIIGSNVSVPCSDIVQNQVLINSQEPCKLRPRKAASKVIQEQSCTDTFCRWPEFSYAGCFKRIADIVGSAVVIILFVPVIPFLALAIKLNSPGPVFFRTKRQGLGGREFNCLKFRTMTAGADEMQDRLRVVNQMDGPQFKIDNDPRVNTVGRFLRDTYIDEIPQFFNVLLGQMSIVGPRPSPETENTLCPSWRDARLSVRPGITGLWQVLRTRQPMKDFQEWIYYDTEYVRKLSLKLDIYICFRTAKKMTRRFLSQF
jgi:lipopolysaccharide/colanic/teichoic acid biosynthesis glycosyltransferase